MGLPRGGGAGGSGVRVGQRRGESPRGRGAGEAVTSVASIGWAGGEDTVKPLGLLLGAKRGAEKVNRNTTKAPRPV